MSAPCTGLIEDRDGELTIPCGDEGRLCDDCWDNECDEWARYFGQDSGTKAQKAVRLAAMKPDMPREADRRSDAEMEEECPF